MKAVQQRQAAARSERAQCGHGAGNMQLAANAGCRRDPDSEGTCCTNEALQGWSAVQRHVLSCKLQLHADAGCRRDPVSEGTCCTNEALQGWSAVQRHVPELRDAAGCECRLTAR